MKVREVFYFLLKGVKGVLIERNTAYLLNDKVESSFGLKLKCITAGTTSSNPIDFTPPLPYNN